MNIRERLGIQSSSAYLKFLLVDSGNKASLKSPQDSPPIAKLWASSRTALAMFADWCRLDLEPPKPTITSQRRSPRLDSILGNHGDAGGERTSQICVVKNTLKYDAYHLQVTELYGQYAKQYAKTLSTRLDFVTTLSLAFA